VEFSVLKLLVLSKVYMFIYSGAVFETLFWYYYWPAYT